MKLTSPWTGILSFLIVLFTMPLGHAAMILMEKCWVITSFILRLSDWEW